MFELKEGEHIEMAEGNTKLRKNTDGEICFHITITINCTNVQLYNVIAEVQIFLTARALSSSHCPLL